MSGLPHVDRYKCEIEPAIGVYYKLTDFGARRIPPVCFIKCCMAAAGRGLETFTPPNRRSPPRTRLLPSFYQAGADALSHTIRSSVDGATADSISGATGDISERPASHEKPARMRARIRIMLLQAPSAGFHGASDYEI
jgi:hypothetical protein